jgi:titin
MICLLIASFMMTAFASAVPAAAAASGDEVVPAAPQNGVPDQVGNLVADVGDNLIWLWWDFPVSQGTELVKQFKIYRSDVPSPAVWNLLADVNVGINTYEDNDVVNGAIKYYKVVAQSDAGVSAGAFASGTPTAAGTAPSAPTDVRVINNVYAGKVSWSSPANNGSQPVRRYLVFRGADAPGNISYDAPYAVVDADTFTYTDDNVLPGREYYYSVVAESAAGQGAESAPSGVLIAGTDDIPTAPLELHVMPNNHWATLWWMRPDNPSANGIACYNIYRGTSQGGENPAPIGQVVPFGDTLNTIFVDFTVTNEITYWYYVKAVNGDGASVASNEAFGQPSVNGVQPLAPLVPFGIGAYPGNNQVLVNWIPQLFIEGYYVRVTGFEVYRSLTSGGAGTLVATLPSTTFRWTDGTVTNGITYYYTVRSQWPGGLSDPSPEMSATPTATGTAPSAPVLWGTPDYAGPMLDVVGHQTPTQPYVLSYDVYRSATPDVGAATKVGTFTDALFVTDSMSWWDSNALPQDTYYYWVKAVGFYGTSSFSNMVHAFATDEGQVPFAPTGPGANYHDRQVDLVWTAPGNMGTANWVDYIIYRQTGAGEWEPWDWFEARPGDTLSYTDTLVEGGNTYSYCIAAENNFGEGDPSSVASVTVPERVPSEPRDLAGTPGNHQASLSWLPPADTGGSAIDYYVVYRGGVEIAQTASTSYVATGLTNGEQYSFTVAAHNAAGLGPQCWPIIVTPAAIPPTAPRNLNGVAGDAQASLTWDPPASQGGSPIDYYVVYRDGVEISQTASTSYVATGLTNGVPYSFAVAAHNADGLGPQCDPVVVTPTSGLPTAPRNLNGVPGNAQASLTWDPPASSGSSPIDYYVIYQNGVDVGHPTATNAVITGLTNGATYNFAVAAHNAAGVGPQSDVRSVVPFTKPTAPQNLTATPGNGQVTLTWAAPAFNGGRAIDYYVIYRDGMAVRQVTTLSYVETGLTNGQAYAYRLAAHNAAGEGDMTPTVLATPFTTPNAPQNLIATPGNAQAVLTWAAPAFNGGRAIDGYVIFKDGVEVATVGAGVTTYTATGLTNGVQYTFLVRAHNEAGNGAAANATATPATVPGTPRNLAAVPGDGSVALTWAAPLSNGGAAIDYYVILVNGTQAGQVNALSFTVNGLVNGQSYSFQIRAHNAMGLGDACPAVNATPTPGQPPGPPTNVAAAPGDGCVVVTWNAPTSSGSTPIDTYYVYRDGVEVARTAAMSYNSTGLVNGQKYEFFVRAHNSIGLGPSSEVVNATPRQSVPPGPPTNLNAAVGNGYAYLTWDAPTSGSDPVDYYILYKNGEDISHPTARWFNVTGLVNGVTCNFTVRAHSAAGNGALSAQVSAVPYTVPGVPQNLRVETGDARATLTWAAPSFDGGRAVDSYSVYQNGAYIATVGATSLQVTNLTNGMTYAFTVKAHNLAGLGAAAIVNATPATLPSAPRSVTATAGTMKVTITWLAPASDGGSSLTAFKVYLQLAGGSQLRATLGPTALVYEDTNVTGGTAYTYYVVAVNAVGSSVASSTATATPQSAPAAQDNTMVIVAVVIVVIIIALVAVVVMRRKK